MIKVQRHGNKISVRNPITGKETTMVVIVFVEQGRSGGDSEMSDSSLFLDSLVGGKTGLDSIRTHSHPVREDQAAKFEVGKEFPGHINRKLYTTPQLRSQENVESRMIDGQPTYFKTFISDTAQPDVDLRVSNDALMSARPDLLFKSRVGGTDVRIIEAVAPVASQQEVPVDLSGI